MKPFIGSKVEIQKASDGNGRLHKSSYIIDTVQAVYLDGKVRVSSGDIWSVVPHKDQSKAQFAAIR